MLMKLLQTTNTLSEAKDQPHRYKVRSGGLPTFGNATEPAVRNFGGASAARVKVEPAVRPARAVASGGWVQKLNPFVMAVICELARKPGLFRANSLPLTLLTYLELMPQPLTLSSL